MPSNACIASERNVPSCFQAPCPQNTGSTEEAGHKLERPFGVQVSFPSCLRSTFTHPDPAFLKESLGVRETAHAQEVSTSCFAAAFAFDLPWALGSASRRFPAILSCEYGSADTMFHATQWCRPGFKLEAVRTCLLYASTYGAALDDGITRTLITKMD